MVGIISPWNWPADIPNIAATHALGGGDAIVLKPASTTPFSVSTLAEIYEEAGFRQVRECGHRSRHRVGAELVRNPGTNAIHFTGETATGEYLTQIAGVKRLLLELGGNGPLVVMDDANVDEAVEATIVGCFYLAGQVCTASERVLVHRAITTSSSRNWRHARPRVGSEPARRGHRHGAAQQPRQRSQGPGAHDDARERGGEFLCGGTIEGLYWTPTIVDGVTSEFLMARDETFGPWPRS